MITFIGTKDVSKQYFHQIMIVGYNDGNDDNDTIKHQLDLLCEWSVRQYYAISHDDHWHFIFTFDECMSWNKFNQFLQIAFLHWNFKIDQDRTIIKSMNSAIGYMIHHNNLIKKHYQISDIITNNEHIDSIEFDIESDETIYTNLVDIAKRSHFRKDFVRNIECYGFNYIKIYKKYLPIIEAYFD